MSASTNGSTPSAPGSPACRSERRTQVRGWRPTAAVQNLSTRCAIVVPSLAGTCANNLLAGIRQRVEIVIQTFFDAAAAGTDAGAEAMIIRLTGLPRVAVPVLCARPRP